MEHAHFSYISCNENDLFAVLRDGSCPFALQVDFRVNSVWFQFEPGVTFGRRSKVTFPNIIHDDPFDRTLFNLLRYIGDRLVSSCG